MFLPASGNRWGTDVNNVGNNGNYWSSTENNENNAYNVNFNSNNLNPQNNNNRNNGQAVRLAQDFTLLQDLFRAYYDARRHKRKTHSQLAFEIDLERNVIDLYYELRDRTYRPSSSICFIITDPKKREVFASSFRDRVVHHLYYNYVVGYCDKQFINDSYSCRVGKGTLFGIKRLEHHIRSVSDNYQQEAYVLKLDLLGYFMSISRELLRIRVHGMLQPFLESRDVSVEKANFIRWLTDVICLKNPLDACRIRGERSDWCGLPPSKSLWHSPQGVGLPIGDLTSQLFSNIYLNDLDRYVVDTLGFVHYGRYVDDFYLLDRSKERLQVAVNQINTFLSGLGMTLHPNKIILQPVSLPSYQQRVPALEFLGALVYPYYRHCTRRTTAKYHSKCSEWAKHLTIMGCHKETTTICDEYWESVAYDWQNMWQSWQSYRGYLSHFRSSRL